MDLETSIAHNSKVLFCDLVTFSTKLFKFTLACKLLTMHSIAMSARLDRS